MKGRIMYFMLGCLPALLISCSSTPSPTVDAAAASPTVQPSSPVATPIQVSQAGPTVLASGNFVSGEHATSGSVILVEENGQQFIEFGDDFSTDSGPDLVVILHRSADVIGTTAPPAHAIAEADYVVLNPLQSTTGAQRYSVPADVNLADYSSVAVWCRQFNATFGAAAFAG